jgi:hypothetical protein
MTSVEYGRGVTELPQVGSARARHGAGLSDERRRGPANSTSARPRPVPRIALTRREAAESIGVGLTTFKQQVQPQLRMVRRGKVRLIPVTELERWLEENAEAVVDD